METVELCEVARLVEADEALSPLFGSDLVASRCSGIPPAHKCSRFVPRVGKGAAERWPREFTGSKSKSGSVWPWLPCWLLPGEVSPSLLQRP